MSGVRGRLGVAKRVAGFVLPRRATVQPASGIAWRSSKQRTVRSGGAERRSVSSQPIAAGPILPGSGKGGPPIDLDQKRFPGAVRTNIRPGPGRGLNRLEMGKEMFETAKDDFSAARLVSDILQGFGADEQSRILRWAAEKAGLADDSTFPHRTVSEPAGSSDRASTYDSFLAGHASANDMQFAAAVAYALQRLAPADFRKDVVTGEDVRDAATRLGRKGPRFPGQTLINAQGQGLLKKVEYGRYSLTAKGIKSVEQVTGGDVHSSKKGRKVPPKFINPQDSAQTWSGRGLQPVWLRTALRQGKQLEDFRIG